MASNSPAPRFAEGEDPQKLGSDTAALQQQGWALDPDGMGVTKTFHFKSYFKAVVSDFVLGPQVYSLTLDPVLCELDCFRERGEKASSHYDCGECLKGTERDMIDRLRLVQSESGPLMSTGPHITRAGSAPRILQWPGIVTMGLG